MNKNTARLLASMVGEIVEIAEEPRDFWGKYLRVRVIVDVTKPLKRGLRVWLAEFEMMLTVLLKYERLPEFCHRCGMVGHSVRECMLKASAEGDLKFGSWLKATPHVRFNGRPFRKTGDGNFASSSKDRAESEPPNFQQRRTGFCYWEDDGMGEVLGENRGLDEVDVMGDSLMVIKEGSELINIEVGQSDDMAIQNRVSKRWKRVVRSPVQRKLANFPSPIKKILSIRSKSRSCSKSPRLGNPRALAALKKVLRSSSPDLVFLCETRLRGVWAEQIKRKLGFENGFHVNCEGKSGGLILLWNNLWDVEIKSFSKSHIDSFVRMDDGNCWRFTGLYGCPHQNLRRDFWELLKRLKMGSSLPWLCGGDLNEILVSSEKLGGTNRLVSGMNDFRNALDFCNLDDLGFRGPLFTWSNKRVEAANVQERLDRFLANQQWKYLFPGALVENLDFLFSDHRPILLNLQGSRRKDIRRKLKSCASHLEVWSRSIFGSLRKYISEKHEALNLLLAGVQSVSSAEKIRVLEKELSSLLAKEELYWQQRARTDWMISGDKNTKFFHARATARKRKNEILKLVDEFGVCHEDDEGIANTVSNYFSSLFKSSSPSVQDLEEASCNIKNRFSEDMLETISADFSADEVRAAVFSLGPSKAPGPDGFHALFFQKFWVASFIDSSSHSWDPCKLDSFFLNIDKELILSIPLSCRNEDDVLIWHFDKHGHYSVKSGYKLAIAEKFKKLSSGSSSDQHWWLSLWNLHIPQKIKIFIWKVCKNAIPSLSNLLKVETVEHALLWCSGLDDIWVNSQFEVLLRNFNRMKCFDLLRWVFSKSSRADFDLLDHAGFYLAEFQNTLASVSPLVPRPVCSGSVGWSPPPCGSLKLNCDAAVRIDKNFIGVGAAIRDSSGHVVVASSHLLSGFFSPEIGEFLALREGLLLASHHSLQVVGVSSCQAISRSRNGLAHMLASFALSSMEDYVWLDVRPSCLFSGS
ncbi:hypothetical protein ACOSQ2_010546 [Xanthoceras sorbifolium]